MPKATLQVRLIPRGGGDQILRREGETLHLRVSAPPIDGKANRALIALLAEALDVPKSSISIQSGATSRNKRLAVEGLDSEILWRRLEAHLPQSRPESDED